MIGNAVTAQCFPHGSPLNTIESFRQVQADYPNRNTTRQSFVNQQIRGEEMFFNPPMCSESVLFFRLSCI